jgi:AcrR family transcriptional regulator
MTRLPKRRAAPPKRRTRLLSADRRQAILDAALALFAAKGYDGVSLDEIVRVAGGSKSSVYQLFGGKQGLLQAVTESLAEQMLSEMRFQPAAGEDVRATLERIGLKLIRLILSDSAITQCRLAINNLTVDPTLSRVWYQHGPATTFDGFGRYLAQEVAAGRLRIANCQLAADAFLGMLICRHHLAMSIGEPAPSPRQMKRIVAEAVDVFLAAYGA